MTKKSDKYTEERQALVDQLIDILNLDLQRSFILYELDHNPEKQEEIMALIPEIKKYYSHGLIGGIKDQDKHKRPWLSIIKHLLRDYYNIISSEYLHQINEEGTKLKTRRYYLNETLINNL